MSARPLPNKWAIAIAAATVHSLHAACVYIGPSTLLSPMRHSLNLSVAQATQPLVAFRLVQAIFLIPVGYILDLYPQFYLRASMVCAALLSPLLPLSTSLSHLIILQTLLGITKLFGGLSAMLIIVTRAFPDCKGHATATGIVLGGFSFAGFLAPTAIAFVSVRTDWRVASAMLSLLFAVVGLPLTFLCLREFTPPTTTPFSSLALSARSFLTRKSRSNADSVRKYVTVQSERVPKGLGLEDKASSMTVRRVSRREAVDEVISSDEEKASMKRAEVLLSAPYIAVLFAVAAYSFSVHIIFDHFVIFLSEDFGMPFDRAILYMSLLNLIAMFAKLSIGPIADRYNKALIMAICSVISGLSCLLLLEYSGDSFSVTSSIFKINCFTFTYAIGFAAVFSVTTSILREFGTERFGLRSNINVMTAVTTGSLGSYVAGWLRTNLGSYKWPFIWNTFVWLLVCTAAMFKYIVYDKQMISGGRLKGAQRVENNSS